MENQKVSIVIPCYNVEKYVDMCLQSVLSQTYENLEIICVNDGSTDRTLDILKSYADKDDRIQIIDQENRGLGASRNVGLDNATGTYISFIDSDDWISEDFIEDLYVCAQFDKADIAVASIVQAVPDEIIGFEYKNILGPLSRECSDNANEKYKMAGVFKHNYVWNKLYRLDTLRRINVRFEEGVLFEDLVFTNKVIYYTKRMVTVPFAKYFYRRQQVSLMWGKSDKWLKDFNQAQQRALRFRQSINPEISDITEFDWNEIDRYKLFNFTLFTVKTYGLTKLYYLFDRFLVFQKEVKRRMYIDEK